MVASQDVLNINPIPVVISDDLLEDVPLGRGAKLDLTLFEGEVAPTFSLPDIIVADKNPVFALLPQEDISPILSFNDVIDELDDVREFSDIIEVKNVIEDSLDSDLDSSDHDGDSGGGGGNGGGPPPGKGPGGEEGSGNNLSFPVIFPDGVTPLTLRGQMDDLKLTDPYFAPGEYDADHYWFHQKSEGNEWQAYNEQAEGSIAIDKIDIGDALEAAPIELDRFIRIELALFKDVGDLENPDDGQLAYYMEKIDGQGSTEVQGTPYTEDSLTITGDLSAIEALDGLTTYRSDLATVYAPSEVMNLTIQKFADSVDPDDVTGLWDGDKWVGIGIERTNYAASTAFGAELTVSGKVISGVSGKPFRFTEAGNYRITFEIEGGASIFLDESTEAYNVAGGRTMNIVPDSEPRFREIDLLPDNLGSRFDGRERNFYLGEDLHNGLIYMDIEVPSSVSGEDEVLSSQFLNLAAANQSSF